MEIHLKNFRSIIDSGSIEIKPINVLLGKNSSGKSSLTRVFPLLQQSIITRTSSPILWSGDLVDFGSIDDVVSSYGGGDTEIGLKFQDIRIHDDVYYHRNDFLNKKYEVSANISFKSSNNKTRIKSLVIKIEDDVINFEINNNKLTGLFVNSYNYSTYVDNFLIRNQPFGFIPIIDLFSGKSQMPRVRPMEFISEKIYSLIKNYIHGNIKESSAYEYIQSLVYAPLDDYLDINKKFANIMPDTLRNAIFSNKNKSGLFSNIRDLLLIGVVPNIINQLDRHITQTFYKVYYTGPNRASGNRFYRTVELAIDQLEPDGSNLSAYLQALNKAELDRYKDLVRDALDVDIQLAPIVGHVSLQIRNLEEKSSWRNLSDVGYGYSQYLPVIAQLHASLRPGNSSRFFNRGQTPLFVVEQPELHLHPAIQAKFADLMVNVLKSVRDEVPPRRKVVAPRFVIETHSEAMINRLGYLINEGMISSDDVNVLMFDKISGQPTSIKKLKFDECGTINEWPIGFFSA